MGVGKGSTCGACGSRLGGTGRSESEGGNAGGAGRVPI